MTDQELAFILYKEGASQKEIAGVFRKTEVTIGRWKKDGDWDRRKTQSEIAKHSAQEDAQEILNYQLRALKKKKEEYEQGGGTQLIAKGDIDGIRDLFNCTKDRQVEWTLYVKVVRSINRYFKELHPALAAEAAQPLDDFLLYIRKSLQQ